MADSDNDSGGPNSASPREQDRFLPIANVSRIMKKALPANAKISKDAKETVQECVSEFISFITGEASDKCQREKRKTINGDDLLWAMTTLGFEDYVDPLKIYLQKFREMEGERTAGAALGRGQGFDGGGSDDHATFAANSSGGGSYGGGMYGQNSSGVQSTGMMMTMGQNQHHQGHHHQYHHMFGSSDGGGGGGSGTSTGRPR